MAVFVQKYAVFTVRLSFGADRPFSALLLDTLSLAYVSKILSACCLSFDVCPPAPWRACWLFLVFRLLWLTSFVVTAAAGPTLGRPDGQRASKVHESHPIVGLEEALAHAQEGEGAHVGAAVRVVQHSLVRG